LGNSGISKVKVNGVRASGDTARGDGVANWEMTITLNPGYNKIIVEAFDDAPNKNSILKIITVKYNPPDTTGPEVKLIKPQHLSVIVGNIIEFEATASDPSGVDCVIFCIQSPSLGNNPDWSGPIEGFYYYIDETPPYSAIYDWTHLGDGTYSIGVLAKDKVGRWSNPVAAIIEKRLPKFLYL